MIARAKTRARIAQGVLGGVFACIVGAQLFGTALVAPLISARFRGQHFIEPMGLFQKLERGEATRLFDVRTPAEFAVSHLRGALRVDPESEIALAPDTLTVVAYCSVGYRSGAFAARQAARGLRVLNLEGGIFAWARLGLPLALPPQKGRGVHPYNPFWGLLLPFHLHAYR